MYDNTEKRKYERIDISYTTRFRIKQYEGREMFSPDRNIIAVKNLSAGGMLFDYNKNLGFDSLLDLKIDFFKSIPAINCIGRVVRIEERQSDSMFRIATEFTEISEQEKETINTTVEENLRKEAKTRDCYLEKLEKMIEAMTRSAAREEVKQENSTTLKIIDAMTRGAAKKEAIRSTGIKKEFIKSKNVCRVTFNLPRDAAPDAKSVYIVGDFNNWDIHADPITIRENEDYTISLDLEQGRQYEFRYLIDESKWENDWNADKYVKSPYEDCDNSVVITDTMIETPELFYDLHPKENNIR
jgi:hypothetical protein